MKSSLPKHIIKSLLSHKTSLGEHPALPPDEETSFLYYLVDDYYSEICSNVNNNNIVDITNEIQKVITQCQKIESKNIDTLQNLCVNLLNVFFEIPADTINIECKIAQNIDTSKQRLIPEKTTDFSFDDIDDMNYLTNEIYKRRMLNVLIAGASFFYANQFDLYVRELFQINPELPFLYKKLIDLNTKLVYLKQNTLDIKEQLDCGKVDVLITSQDDKITVKAEGIVFPLLLENAIKGILEVAIINGLPEDDKKAEYVIKKSDFKLAELWDLRLGIPLWKNIESLLETNDIDLLNDKNLNFIFYELSHLNYDDFNSSLMNIFKHTKKGEQILVDLVSMIQRNKEQDDFNDFITQKNLDTNIIQDGKEYFTTDELNNL